MPRVFLVQVRELKTISIVVRRLRENNHRRGPELWRHKIGLPHHDVCQPTHRLKLLKA